MLPYTKEEVKALDLDLEVLNSLPPGLKAEVLEEYRVRKSQKKEKERWKKVMHECTETIYKNMEPKPLSASEDEDEDDEISNSQLFSEESYPQLRKALQNWIYRTPSPALVHLELLAQNMSFLVRMKNMELLHRLLKVFKLFASNS